MPSFFLIMNFNWTSFSTNKKPLGRLSPWVWSVEMVRGCNLQCWHCSTRIFPEDHKKKFMSESTWKAMFNVVARMTPRGRFELAQGGEPTLHPDLFNFIRLARKISPTTQIQLYTNGITLLAGKISYDQLFKAGIHAVYVDMYGSINEHVKLAIDSGVEWYMYNKQKIGSDKHSRKANTYYGDPAMRLIILQNNPEKRIGWRKVGRLSTFLNHIDWPAAIPHGLVPVRVPYTRRCTLPQRYVSTDWMGNYIFCCIDFTCESAGLLGNVSEGPDGFKRFWFGRLMQSIRRRLFDKERKDIPYCKRCNCAFAKCDWKIWPDGSFDQFWDGDQWKKMPLKKFDDEVFADGWEKAKIVDASLPTIEEEISLLLQSGKRIINSRTTINKITSQRKGFCLFCNEKKT